MYGFFLLWPPGRGFVFILLGLYKSSCINCYTFYIDCLDGQQDRGSPFFADIFHREASCVGVAMLMRYIFVFMQMGLDATSIAVVDIGSEAMSRSCF